MPALNGNKTAAVEAAVFRAVDLLNELMEETQQLEKSRNAPLLEKGSVLDSLAVINLLVSVEDQIKDTFGRELVLAGEDGTGELTPESLQTVGSLIDAVQMLLERPS